MIALYKATEWATRKVKWLLSHSVLFYLCTIWNKIFSHVLPFSFETARQATEWSRQRKTEISTMASALGETRSRKTTYNKIVHADMQLGAARPGLLAEEKASPAFGQSNPFQLQQGCRLTAASSPYVWSLAMAALPRGCINQEPEWFVY